MKKAILLSFLFSSLAHAAPQIIPAPVSHLYVPQGFDNNDAVEVVVTGYFTNTCFSRNTVNVDIKEDKINISVSAIANEDTKRLCAEMIVPFKEVVSIGNLQGGDYDINVNGVLKDSVSIKEASSNATDDHLYADIESVERKSGTDFVLKGWRFSNCIELDKIEVVSNGKDTLSILPVMKQVSNFCPMKMMPIAYPVKLDFSSVKVKEPLIHVRTMDGKSFNKIIYAEDRR
ncbi:MAG: hypothetical protein AB7I27_03510 [Bacteriovoracaceae bacterium]